MPERQKVEYSQLSTDYEFPPASYRMDSSVVTDYLTAVEEADDLYQDTDVVPPMAVAARAMTALSENLSIPSGAIHVSQEFTFIGVASTRDNLTSYARVIRKQERGRLRLLTIGFGVFNQNNDKVLAGRTSFILPETG